MDRSAINTKGKPAQPVGEVNHARPGADTVPEMVLTRIRLRALRSTAWLRKLWRENGNEGGQSPDYHATIDAILGGGDNPEAEAAWLRQEKSLRPWNQELAQVEKALGKDRQSNFAFLHRQFGLKPEESDMLQTMLALALEPQMERVYAYLQDHSGRGYVTGTLVSRLFGYPQPFRLGAGSALRIWDIIREKESGMSEPPRMECDPHIRQWLMGSTDLDEALMGMARFSFPQEPLPGWPLAEAWQFITQILAKASHQRIRLCIAGTAGSGRKTFAACVASQLNMPLLVLDTNRIADDKWEPVYIHAQRYAYLSLCALAWSGEDLEKKWWPQIVTPFQIQFMLCDPGQIPPPIEGVVDFRLSLPALTIEARRQIWQQHVPAVTTWPEKEVAELTRRYQVNIGQIAAIAQHQVETIPEATVLLKAFSRHHMGKLAQSLECPFRWDDLIVSDWLKQYLEDFVFEAAERETLWEDPAARRLFPQGKGLLALFTGPPGTGKTMAAQVIAAQLELDLFRIDLSAVVSKYVGETSKNLERILAQARQMNAVLLFDEADALFGKRTEIKDAHDRYANTDTNYLLQAIESYPGLAILASNKKANIDAGFMRRLRFILEFPKPDMAQRLQIWERVTGELAGEERLAFLKPKLRCLAETIELTGAQIKFTILSALFISRKEKIPMTIRHVLLGLERELMKEGRGISRELQDLVREKK